MNTKAKGDLCIRVMAFPKDANPSGDVFGGWLMSQMDIAGGIFCRKVAKGRVVTIAADAMTFPLPVFVGDTLCCYVSLIKIGTTSIKVRVEVWVNRDFEEDTEASLVTVGDYTYVKLVDGKPSPII